MFSVCSEVPKPLLSLLKRRQKGSELLIPELESQEVVETRITPLPVLSDDYNQNPRTTSDAFLQQTSLCPTLICPSDNVRQM
jgi:hypothetical protein